jgi:hypothetical protein
MKIVALDTGLFPDRETMEAAVGKLEADHEVRHIAVPAQNQDEQSWDRVLAEILASDLVVAV